jgi:hypothetical protein
LVGLGVSPDEKIFTPTDERGFLPYTLHPTPYTPHPLSSQEIGDSETGDRRLFGSLGFGG